MLILYAVLHVFPHLQFTDSSIGVMVKIMWGLEVSGGEKKNLFMFKMCLVSEIGGSD